MNIYKLLLALCFVFATVVGAPLVAAHYGWLPGIPAKAWLILVVTACGLAAKAAMGDFVAGEFSFAKTGYDNCMITFGSVLGALALQLTSQHDFFPGMAAIFALPELTGQPAMDKAAYLLVLLLVSLVATMVTGRIAAAVKHEKPRGADALSLLAYLVGALSLFAYALLLLTKG